jgi:hypothetical protein
MPVSNIFTGSSSLNGGYDFGIGLNEINVKDIESVKIVKGASGAIKYGSLSGNGIIEIRTKEIAYDSPIIKISSQIAFQSPLMLPIYQEEYGQGLFGSRDIRENTSWGPRLDGVIRYWGYEVDLFRMYKPYEAVSNNLSDFFDTGLLFYNTASFQKKFDLSSIYFSYSNIHNDGIMPLNKDMNQRHTFTVRTISELNEHIEIKAFVNYINNKKSSHFTGQGKISAYNQVLQTPVDIPLYYLEDYESPYVNLDNFYSAYSVNPYYVLNEFSNEFESDRLIGFFDLHLQLHPNIKLSYTLGGEFIDSKRYAHEPIMDPEGINDSNENWANTNEGAVFESDQFYKRIYSDIHIEFNKKLRHFNYSQIVGADVYQRGYSYKSASIRGLDIPDYYELSNSSSEPTIQEDHLKQRLGGIYALTGLSFKDLVIVNLELKNDYSSTLRIDNNSNFYYSLGAQFHITHFLKNSDWLNNAYLYTSWGKTAKELQAYLTGSSFEQAIFQGESYGTSLVFPLAGGLNAYTISDRTSSADLGPEIIHKFDVGIRFLSVFNRIIIDYTYYSMKSNQLLFSDVSPYSSGFSSQYLNYPNTEVINKGSEILLMFIPVDRKDLLWNIHFQFSKNTSEVLNLPEQFTDAERDLKSFTLISHGTPGTGYTNLAVIEGFPFGVFEYNPALTVTDESSEYYGSIIVDGNSGLPVMSIDQVIAGNSNFKYTMGFGSSLEYKGLEFYILFDYRKGGLLYSRTADMAYFTGNTAVTLYNDRQAFIIPNSVVRVYENGEVIGYEENTIPISNNLPNGSYGSNMMNYWQNGGTELNNAFLIPRSYLKLRDISLNYTVPSKWIHKLYKGSLSIGVYGHNLFIFTAEENIFIDPETSSYGTDLISDFGELGTTPSYRTYGFKIDISF